MVSYDPDNPRILLIKFLHWDKKMAVLKECEKLRKVGLRVGDDLTRRQRDRLKQLSEKCQSGYFYKGELHIRDKKKERSSSTEDSNDKIETRTFVKAFRKNISVVTQTKITRVGPLPLYHKQTFKLISVEERVMTLILMIHTRVCS